MGEEGRGGGVREGEGGREGEGCCDAMVFEE